MPASLLALWSLAACTKWRPSQDFYLLHSRMEDSSLVEPPLDMERGLLVLHLLHLLGLVPLPPWISFPSTRVRILSSLVVPAVEWVLVSGTMFFHYQLHSAEALLSSSSLPFLLRVCPN